MSEHEHPRRRSRSTSPLPHVSATPFAIKRAADTENLKMLGKKVPGTHGHLDEIPLGVSPRLAHFDSHVTPLHPEAKQSDKRALSPSTDKAGIHASPLATGVEKATIIEPQRGSVTHPAGQMAEVAERTAGGKEGTDKFRARVAKDEEQTDVK